MIRKNIEILIKSISSVLGIKSISMTTNEVLLRQDLTTKGTWAAEYKHKFGHV